MSFYEWSFECLLALIMTDNNIQGKKEYSNYFCTAVKHPCMSSAFGLYSFFKQQEFSTSPVTQGLTENRLLLPGLVRRKAAFRVRLASQPVSLFTRARTHVTKPEKCCLVFCYRAFLPYVNLRCGICAVKPYT